jgi:hypothetical protein
VPPRNKILALNRPARAPGRSLDLKCARWGRVRRTVDARPSSWRWPRHSLAASRPRQVSGMRLGSLTNKSSTSCRMPVSGLKHRQLDLPVVVTKPRSSNCCGPWASLLENVWASPMCFHAKPLFPRIRVIQTRVSLPCLGLGEAGDYGLRMWAMCTIGAKRTLITSAKSCNGAGA